MQKKGKPKKYQAGGSVSSGVRRRAMAAQAARQMPTGPRVMKKGGTVKKKGYNSGGAVEGEYKSPKTVKSTIGRKDPATGRMAGKKRVKTKGTGAATKGTGHTSYT